MSKRRGKRVVVGYVVSYTGKRGGPWEARDGSFGTATSRLADASRLTPEFVRTCASKDARGHCFYTLGLIRKHHPHARALPLVRYEVDAEEERLRDAVVEAAVVAHEALELVRDISSDVCQTLLTGGDSDAISAEHDVAGPAYHEKHVALFAAVRALRAHREKVGK